MNMWVKVIESFFMVSCSQMSGNRCSNVVPHACVEIAILRDIVYNFISFSANLKTKTKKSKPVDDTPRNVACPHQVELCSNHSTTTSPISYL